MNTLAPTEVLLLRVAQLLERDVLPHVTGEPFMVTVEAAEQLRRIAGVLAMDDLPDYCAEAGCQNIAKGSTDLCLTHLIEVAIERRVLLT